jgi:hypothetical protein
MQTCGSGEIRNLKKKKMHPIQKKYLTDENRKPVAVQVDIQTFEKIEQFSRTMHWAA